MHNVHFAFWSTSCC